MHVTRDAGFLNSVANHVSVRGWLGLDVHGSLSSKLDLQPIFDSGQGHALVNEHGGYVLIDLGQGVWEIHTMFLPSGRGAPAYEAAREVMAHVFHETDCQTLYTQLPNNNPQAKAYARWGGFRKIEDRPSPWREAGGVGEDWALTREAWAERSARLEGPKMESKFAQSV